MQKRCDRLVVLLHPKLAEGERTCPGRIEPDGTLCRLAELRAALGEQERVAEPKRVRRAIGVLALRSPNQLRASGDVPPLVRAAHLELHAVQLPQHHEVVALQQHVAELGERETALKPRLYALLREHVADGEVLPCVAKEIDQPKVAEPAEVIQQQRAALPREVDEISELRTDRGAVVVQRRSIQKIPFGRSARGVADHAGPSANECDGATTVQLESSQRKDTHQVPNME